MQSSPPALRIAQAVATIAGARDSIASINTTEFSPDAIVACAANHSLYILHKDSTATPVTPEIIAPAQGGPGRWFRLGVGASYFQSVGVFHPQIPPNSGLDASASVAGVAGAEDVIVFNSNDSGIPTSLMIGLPRVTGVGTAQFRFVNVSGTTAVAATVALEVAVLKG